MLMHAVREAVGLFEAPRFTTPWSRRENTLFAEAALKVTAYAIKV